MELITDATTRPPTGLGGFTEVVPMADHTRRLGMTTDRSTPEEDRRVEEANADGGERRTQ